MSHHWPPLLLLLLSCLSAGAWAQDEYCYSSDADPYDLHAVYTSYFEMQNADDEPIQFEGLSVQSNPLIVTSKFFSITIFRIKIAEKVRFVYKILLLRWDFQFVSSAPENVCGSFFFFPSGCSAISYWAFTRHGARNPRDYEYFDLAVRLVDIQERIMRNYDDGTG